MFHPGTEEGPAPGEVLPELRVPGDDRASGRSAATTEPHTLSQSRAALRHRAGGFGGVYLASPSGRYSMSQNPHPRFTHVVVVVVFTRDGKRRSCSFCTPFVFLSEAAEKPSLTQRRPSSPPSPQGRTRGSRWELESSKKLTPTWRTGPRQLEHHLSVFRRRRALT